jgi:hypothetical protein
MTTSLAAAPARCGRTVGAIDVEHAPTALQAFTPLSLNAGRGDRFSIARAGGQPRVASAMAARFTGRRGGGEGVSATLHSFPLSYYREEYLKSGDRPCAKFVLALRRPRLKQLKPGSRKGGSLLRGRSLLRRL